MAATKTPGARANGARRQPTPKPPALPPVTVAKLEETGALLERLVEENQSVFVGKAHAYREQHREQSSRPLSPQESAQLATSLADASEQGPLELAQDIQAGTLRAYDEPDQREVLLAAGVSTARAFLAAVRRIVALVEMPADEFEKACTDGNLDQAIDERAIALRALEVGEAKARASAAFEHYAHSAGFQAGEAWRLPVQAVWQALNETISQAGSLSSQLIDSAESTAGSPDPRSSTDSPG